MERKVSQYFHVSNPEEFKRSCRPLLDWAIESNCCCRLYIFVWLWWKAEFDYSNQVCEADWVFSLTVIMVAVSSSVLALGFLSLFLDIFLFFFRRVKPIYRHLLIPRTVNKRQNFMLRTALKMIMVVFNKYSFGLCKCCWNNQLNYLPITIIWIDTVGVELFLLWYHQKHFATKFSARVRIYSCIKIHKKKTFVDFVVFLRYYFLCLYSITNTYYDQQ